MPGDDDGFGERFDAAKEQARIHRLRPRGSAGNGHANPSPLALAFGHDAAAPMPSHTVVPGLLYRRSVTLIYGAPKSGKSFLATDLALAVADEWTADWMGLAILHHGPVLYVACEGHAGFWKRLQAAKAHRGWTDAQFPEQFVLATGRPALIAATEDGRLFAPHPDAVLEALASCRGRNLVPVVLVVDTVFRSFGAGNVNSSDHMNAYLASLSQLAELDMAVVAVHHEIKSGGTPAGSVSLTGGSDAVAHVWRDDAGKRWWQVEYAKDDAEGEPRAFRLEVVELGTDPDGQPAASCVVLPDESAAAPKGRPKGPKLPPAAAIGVRALNIALSKAGALLPPTPDWPSNTYAVSVEEWRATYYALKGGEPAANRQAFNRGQEWLLARDIITQQSGLVWLVRQA